MEFLSLRNLESVPRHIGMLARQHLDATVLFMEWVLNGGWGGRCSGCWDREGSGLGAERAVGWVLRGRWGGCWEWQSGGVGTEQGLSGRWHGCSVDRAVG